MLNSEQIKANNPQIEMMDYYFTWKDVFVTELLSLKDFYKSAITEDLERRNINDIIMSQIRYIK